jgi:hypothetical protein
MGFLSGIFSGKPKIKDVSATREVGSLEQSDAVSVSLDGLTGVAKYLEAHKDRPKVARSLTLSGVEKYLINLQSKKAE